MSPSRLASAYDDIGRRQTSLTGVVDDAGTQCRHTWCMANAAACDETAYGAVNLANTRVQYGYGPGMVVIKASRSWSFAVVSWSMNCWSLIRPLWASPLN
jgi:hypothetical protein